MKSLNRAIWFIPCALPAFLVIAVVMLPSFGWESLLVLGGAALALPLVFMTLINHRG